MSKGSWKRPMAVDPNDFNSNWKRIFEGLSDDDKAATEPEAVGQSPVVEGADSAEPESTGQLQDA